MGAAVDDADGGVDGGDDSGDGGDDEDDDGGDDGGDRVEPAGALPPRPRPWRNPGGGIYGAGEKSGGRL